MKHNWERESNGEIDIFAHDADTHNGPRCIDCGRTGCHHCEPEMYKEECPAAPTTIAKLLWNIYI